MGDTIAQTRSKNVSKLSNDPLLARGNTLQSGEDRLKLQELMELCTTLQSRVLALETTKTTQATEIASLKKRFKKLERRHKLRTHGLKTLYKVNSSRRVESSGEECLVHDLDGDEVLAESEVAIKDVNLSVDEVTLAQALAALKSAKVQEKANVIEEPSESITTTQQLTTTTDATIITAASTRPRAKEIVIHEQEQAPTQTVSLQQPSQVKAQDKGKGIMVEESVVEQVKPMKRLEQIGLDEELPKKDTQVPQSSVPSDSVADEAVYKELDDSFVRAATTASSLETESQETIGDTIAQTRSENVSKLSYDPLLARGNILQSGEDSLKLNKLMELCTNLQQRVLDLESIKTTQASEIASLKRRVKKLERRNKLRTHGLKILYKIGSSRRVESSEDEGLGEADASKQGRIADIDANKDIYLVNVQTDEDMFSVTNLDGDEVIVKISVATTTTTEITDVEMTLAQALAKLKSAKPKADKVVIQEPEQGTTTPTLTTTTDAKTITAVSTRPRAKGLVIHKQEQAPTPTVSSQQSSHVKVQDKGKGKMVKPKTVKKMSKKELLRLDEELAFKLQAEEEDEMAFELLRLVKNSLRKAMYLNEVFGSILLVINEAFNEET
ncbi:hypothetical protein Tco_1474124 [Tanacetum coccineum]